MSALAANMHRHIFQHAKNRNIYFLKHIHCFTRINQRNILRRGNHYRTRNGNFLRQSELNIARAWGQIDKQVIDIIPFALKQQLLQCLRQHRSTPYNSLFRIHQKTYRHHLNATCCQHRYQLAIHLIGFFIDHPQHRWLARTI